MTTLTDAINAKLRSDGPDIPDKIPAKLLDVETPTFQRWRTGTVVPGDENAPALAECLGIDVAAIYVMLGEARRERKRSRTTPPPAEMEERVARLEAQFEELRGAVMRLLGTPAPAAPTSSDPPSDPPIARRGRSVRAS